MVLLVPLLILGLVRWCPFQVAEDCACCLVARSCSPFGIRVGWGFSLLSFVRRCLWAYSVGIFVKLVAFPGTLHWPAAGADLGLGGVSCVELLFLYGLWAGERPVLEKAVLTIDGLDVQFHCRLSRLVQASMFGVRAVFLGVL